jgi:hypothetical protein
MTNKPQGVVGVLSDDRGHVICSVSDFDTSGYGGYTKQEAQQYRVKLKLADAAIRAYCSDIIADVIDTYRREEIINDLIRKKGFVRTLLPVGYDEEAAA